MKKRSNSGGWRRHCNACLDVLRLLNLYNVVGIIERNSFKLEKLHNVSVFKDQETEKLSKIYRNFLLTIGKIGKSKIREKSITNCRA